MKTDASENCLRTDVPQEGKFFLDDDHTMSQPSAACVELECKSLYVPTSAKETVTASAAAAENPWDKMPIPKFFPAPIVRWAQDGTRTNNVTTDDGVTSTSEGRFIVRNFAVGHKNEEDNGLWISFFLPVLGCEMLSERNIFRVPFKQTNNRGDQVQQWFYCDAATAAFLALDMTELTYTILLGENNERQGWMTYVYRNKVSEEDYKVRRELRMQIYENIRSACITDIVENMRLGMATSMYGNLEAEKRKELEAVKDKDVSEPPTGKKSKKQARNRTVEKATTTASIVQPSAKEIENLPSSNAEPLQGVNWIVDEWGHVENPRFFGLYCEKLALVFDESGHLVKTCNDPNSIGGDVDDHENTNGDATQKVKPKKKPASEEEIQLKARILKEVNDKFSALSLQDILLEFLAMVQKRSEIAQAKHQEEEKEKEKQPPPDMRNTVGKSSERPPLDTTRGQEQMSEFISEWMDKANSEKGSGEIPTASSPPPHSINESESVDANTPPAKKVLHYHPGFHSRVLLFRALLGPQKYEAFVNKRGIFTFVESQKPAMEVINDVTQELTALCKVKGWEKNFANGEAEIAVNYDNLKSAHHRTLERWEVVDSFLKSFAAAKYPEKSK